MKDNIRVKTVKVTPSGIIPYGWTKDLRNRLNRHFFDNDFQFLKVEVTNDDEMKTKIF